MGSQEIRCSIEGCNNRRYSVGKGWCQKHLERWKRHGDPLIVFRRFKDSDEPKFTEQCCKICNTVKSLSEFSKSPRHTIGVRPHCKECINAKAKIEYAPKRNKERNAFLQREWYKNNTIKIRNISKRSYLKERQSPVNRISHSISACVVQSIRKGSKANRKTIDLLGYSYDTLKHHLERQFLPGMSWENYGRDGWEIDHIVPIASFKYETPDDPDFRVCWGLTNLRPLWAKQNRSKGAKLMVML